MHTSFVHFTARTEREKKERERVKEGNRDKKETVTEGQRELSE